MKTFYITTPIYYANSLPHLGHLYTTIVADAVHRYKKQRGFDVYFLTGTDEHGQKVERAAQKAGLATGVFADQIAQTFKALAPLLEDSRDAFLQAKDELREALAAFDTRVMAISDNAKSQTVKYMAVKADEVTRRSSDQQGRAMVYAARNALGAEMRAMLQSVGLRTPVR